MHLRDVYRAVSQSVSRLPSLLSLPVRAAAEAQDEVYRGLLLDVVVGERAPVFKLLTCKYQALLVRRDALLRTHTSIHTCTHSCTNTLAHVCTKLSPHVHRRGWHTDFVLNLGFDHVDGVGGFDFQRDSLPAASAHTRCQYMRLTRAYGHQTLYTGTRVASHVSVLPCQRIHAMSVYASHASVWTPDFVHGHARGVSRERFDKNLHPIRAITRRTLIYRGTACA